MLDQERVEKALLAILESVEREDEYLRLQQGKQFKKNNLFWHGFQYLFWSDVDNDWRIPTREQVQEVSSREDTKYIFDFVINIFKAHGESIIAAMSADIPEVRFGPRNAQDPTDNRAVEAADNCVELISKWNRAKLKIIEALFFLATEGFVASYTYNRKDQEYGSVKIPQYGTKPQDVPGSSICENCGYQAASGDQGDHGSDSLPVSQDAEVPTNSEPDEDDQPDQMMAGGQEQEIVQQPNEVPPETCPDCGQPMSQQPASQEDVPFLQGTTLVPKGREIIEIYGALDVRVSSSCRKQADLGYLIHYVDADPAVFKDAYPDHREQIDSDPGQSYERSIRQSSLSMEGFQLNIRLATQKRCWFRRWMFERLDAEFDDIRDEMKKEYPNGVFCSFIGQTMCEPARPESMDKHWTITKAGPSKGVHADPLLQSTVPLQEIHNNLTNLFIMQVEYGVPATYADTEVFDFDGQSKQEVSPGYTYPVTPRPGQSIADAFYTEKTTTVSGEAQTLLNFVKESEQFVSGSFPSIYGGAAEGGSKTLGEYEKSRSFALQRLGLVWYFINVWWGETIHKSLLSFIEHQIDDETLTFQTSPGSWQTKWIRKADLKGSFDRVEPEASSDFPVSFGQKRSTVMALLQLGNEEINSVLLSPENASTVQSYIGLTDFKIPMENQRRKQMREILELIGMDPFETQEGIMATVPVEPLIDDHEVHMEILRDFLVSDAGQDLKKENSGGYANCLAHLMEHKNAMMEQAAEMTPPPMPGPGLPPGGPQGSPPKKPNGHAGGPPQ